MLQINPKISNQLQESLESVTRKWWFLLLCFLMQSLPPFASRGYNLFEIPKVNAYIVTHPVKHFVAELYPVFKIVPIVLIVLTIFLENKMARLFSIYAGVSYVLFAVLQSFSMSKQYGLGVSTGNLVTFLFVAALWLWEGVSRKNDFTLRKRSGWKYWVIPFALLAFWEPVNPMTLQPDFDPGYLLKSGAGLTFCMMTPVYLAILTVYHPRVNLPVLRITSFFGMITGLGNILLEFVIKPAYWWVGVLHVPLLSISAYGLALSLKARSVA